MVDQKMKSERLVNEDWFKKEKSDVRIRKIIELLWKEFDLQTEELDLSMDGAVALEFYKTKDIFRFLKMIADNEVEDEGLAKRMREKWKYIMVYNLYEQAKIHIEDIKGKENPNIIEYVIVLLRRDLSNIMAMIYDYISKKHNYHQSIDE